MKELGLLLDNFEYNNGKNRKYTRKFMEICQHFLKIVKSKEHFGEKMLTKYISVFIEEDSGISFSVSDMLDLDMELAKSTTSKESNAKKKRYGLSKKYVIGCKCFFCAQHDFLGIKAAVKPVIYGHWKLLWKLAIKGRWPSKARSIKHII